MKTSTAFTSEYYRLVVEYLERSASDSVQKSLLSAKCNVKLRLKASESAD